jgi:hypothetical protein
MEYGILALIGIVLGASVAGGLLAAWSCHRRVLVLEESIKVYFTSFDDRLNVLSRIATREQKSDAAKTRWNKKDAQEAELAKVLTDSSNGSTSVALMNAWDPRTWGKQ